MQSVVEKYMQQAINSGNYKNYTALSKKLEMTTSGISAIRNGQSTASEKTLILLAEAAEVDAKLVISEYKIEHSTNYKVTKFWRGVQGGAVASFLLIGVGGSTIIRTLANMYIMLSKLHNRSLIN